jgi:DMSO reductase anchor subunit
MFDNELILLLIFFAIVAPVALGSAARSETFAQNHSSLIAALKGFMFFSCVAGIYSIVELIFPSFTVKNFLLGLLVGSVGGAVFAHRFLLKSQKQKPLIPKLDLGEDKLKTLPNQV